MPHAPAHPSLDANHAGFMQACFLDERLIQARYAPWRDTGRFIV